MRNTGLEEAQAGIKIAGRNSNNLRYANDTTLMAESEEELKSLKMVFAMTSAFSWQNSISFCPASFCTPRQNLPVTLGVS